MKKIFTIILFLSIILFFSGCTNFSGQSSELIKNQVVKLFEDQPIEFKLFTGEPSESAKISESNYCKLAQEPMHGAVKVKENCEAFFEPEKDFFGNDYFYYYTINGGEEIKYRVDLIVLPLNDAPVIKITPSKEERVKVGENVKLVITASDVDSKELKFWSSKLPSGASFKTSEKESVFEWTPTSENIGTYFVQFFVSDSELKDGVEAKIEVYLSEFTYELKVKTDEDKAIEDFELKTPVEEFAKYHCFLVKGGPLHGIVKIRSEKNKCLATYMPNQDYFGEDQFIYSIKEKPFINGLVKISVSPVNDAPKLNDVPNISEEKNSIIDFTLTATDADREALNFSMNGNPKWLSFVKRTSNDNTARVGGIATEAGEWSIVFTVKDAEGLTDSKNMTLTITEPGNQPVCGNGVCETGEDCSNCSQDCGECSNNNGDGGNGSGGGSGGGGGGGLSHCRIEDINYSEWSECINGVQTRTYKLKRRCTGSIDDLLEELERTCEDTNNIEEDNSLELEGRCAPDAIDGSNCLINGKVGVCKNGECVLTKPKPEPNNNDLPQEPPVTKPKEEINWLLVIPIALLIIVLIGVAVFIIQQKNKIE